MRYLFFDIECADGNKAICEFGYVITNEKFEVLQANNILINPEAKFNLTGRKGQKDLILTYPEEEYRKHPTFDYMYDNIKFLLTQKDIIIFGHSVANDISFLCKDCKHYHLPLIDYEIYDIQKMLPVFSIKNGKFTSLKTAFVSLVPECTRNSLLEHNAKDDAMSTMLVFKEMLADLEFSVSDLLDSCPNAKYKAVEHFTSRSQHAKNKQCKTNKKAQVLWGETYRFYENQLENTDVLGNLVTVSGELKNHYNDLSKTIDVIKRIGMIPVDRISMSDYLIVYDDNDKNRLLNIFKHPYLGKIITYEDFINSK